MPRGHDSYTVIHGKLYDITGANPDSWSKKEGIYGYTSYVHMYFAVHVAFYWCIVQFSLCIVSNSERLCVSCLRPGQAWDVKGRKALCCCPVLPRVAPNLWKWPKCASFEVMKAGIE